mgnify:CR=1 FL=1
MDTFIIRRLRMLLAIAWKRGNVTLWLAAIGIAPLFFMINRLALHLDPLLFPSLRRIEVERPVFIIAHPRSGTTFLQGLVSLHPEIASFRTWEMFFPSVILRRAVKPLVMLAEALGLSRLQRAAKGHRIELSAVDEEEGLFLHHLDSEMLTYLCPEGVTDPKYRHRFLRLGWSDSHLRREPLAWFKEYLRRHLYLTRTRRVMLNSNPSVFRMRSLLAEFPDARFVFLSRTPLETVPSYFSLLEHTVGHRLLTSQREAFYRRKYSWSLQLYRYYERMKREVNPERLLVVDFSELTEGAEYTLAVLVRIFRFAGLEVSTSTRRLIRSELKKPRGRSHKNYPLSRFGLSLERIRRDFAGRT